MMRQLVVMATLVLAPTALAAQGAGEARTISLDEAIRLAQQNQPTTVAARNAVKQGQIQVRRNLFNLGFVPTLGVSANWNQRGGDRYAEGVKLPTSGTPWSYGRSLSIGNIVLFDGGQRWYTYRGSQSSLLASETAVVTAQYQVALSVKTAYYAVLTAREQLAAAQRQLESGQQQLAVATAKMNAGSATRADSLTAALAVGQARQALLTADNAVANANAQLTRYVATPFTVTALANDTSAVTPIELSEAELVKLALDGPQIQQNVAQVAAAQASRRGANSGYMPQLSMNLSYGLTIPNSKTFELASGPNGTSTGLGFSVSYQLWDNFQRQQGVANARIQLDNAEASLRDNRFLVQQNIAQQLNTFNTAMQSIQLSQLQIAAAEENVRVIQQQYNLGTKQLLDLLNAQTQLDAARASLIQSRQNARLAKANIEQIIGRDLN